MAEYKYDGVRWNVEVGINTATAPNVVLENGAAHGNGGCNDFKGTYTHDTGSDLVLTFEFLWTDAFCGPEDGSLMGAEMAIGSVVWIGAETVNVADERMTWTSSDDVALVFVRSDDGA